MQKRTNRILSALLVLVMVLSMLPASVFATGNAEGPFAGWSLTLGDNIGVNFYLEEEAANYSVNVTVAGNNAATTAATKDGYYVVTANVEISDQFFGWVLGFGRKAKLIGSDEAVEQFKAYLDKVREMY